MALCKALSYRTLKCAGKAKREREKSFTTRWRHVWGKTMTCSERKRLPKCCDFPDMNNDLIKRKFVAEISRNYANKMLRDRWLDGDV